jgi:hypothetical protein
VGKVLDQQELKGRFRRRRELIDESVHFGKENKV